MPSTPGSHEGAFGLTAPRRFELVVECRLGGPPASCEFATEAGEESTSPERQDAGLQREVLRTCTTSRDVRVWPTASLPALPVRPPPQLGSTPVGIEQEDVAPLSQGSSNTAAAAVDGSDGSDTGGDKMGSKPPPEAAGGREQENRDPSDPFARWGSIGAEGRGIGGGAGAVRREGVEDEELVARGEPPVPRAHPAATRRVSFAPADEVRRR